MTTEAQEKKLVYVRVNPGNKKQIEEASFCEREGFGTGLDPQERPAALRFIARYGNIWLQYSLEDGEKIPTGVVEFIPLINAMMFNPNRFREDLSGSPLKIIMENQERVFRDVRRFAPDARIIYHHGIAMVRRGKGYGTLLLKHALEHTNGTIFCPIDGAKFDKDSGKLQLAPNEASYLLHMKVGFLLVGVADPQVYDEELTYYTFVKPATPLGLAAPRGRYEHVSLSEGDARSVVNKVKRLTVHGFVGKYYNRETHEMEFQKPL